MSSSETRIAQRAHELYREAAHHIDADTSARLRTARTHALATPMHDHRHAQWLLPSGAFAAIALVAMMAWQPSPHDSLRPAAASSSTASGADMDSELPPDAEQADPKLYQNLDFYDWLAANNRPAGRH